MDFYWCQDFREEKVQAGNLGADTQGNQKAQQQLLGVNPLTSIITTMTRN